MRESDDTARRVIGQIEAEIRGSLPTVTDSKALHLLRTARRDLGALLKAIPEPEQRLVSQPLTDAHTDMLRAAATLLDEVTKTNISDSLRVTVHGWSVGLMMLL